jgi:predicted nucleic acid-binding protein
VRRLYVESNFVLELVFSQEQSAACEELLAAGENGVFELVLPSYCLGEPLETLRRRHKERQRLQEGVQTELIERLVHCEHTLRVNPYNEPDEGR